MAEIKVLDNGPLIVSGGVTLLDGEGKTIETKDQYALCRCGLSGIKPICDGAHTGKFEHKARA